MLFRSGRLLFLTFHGEPRMDEHTREHVHESPLVMLLPIGFLAIGAVAAGFVGFHAFVGEGQAAFWGESIKVLVPHGADAEHHVSLWVAILPTAAAIVGFGIAYGMYLRDPALPGRLRQRFGALYDFLLHKWYFDELYDRAFVRPSWWLGVQFWRRGDGAIIDGLGPDGVAASAVRLARQASLVQTGYVYHYAFAMLIGVVLLVGWYVWGGALMR
mgnify:FL=1